MRKYVTTAINLSIILFICSLFLANIWQKEKILEDARSFDFYVPSRQVADPNDFYFCDQGEYKYYEHNTVKASEILNFFKKYLDQQMTRKPKIKLNDQNTLYFFIQDSYNPSKEEVVQIKSVFERIIINTEKQINSYLITAIVERQKEYCEDSIKLGYFCSTIWIAKITIAKNNNQLSLSDIKWFHYPHGTSYEPYLLKSSYICNKDGEDCIQRCDYEKGEECCSREPLNFEGYP